MKFQVRFLCYQYNCGGGYRNGHFTEKKNFDTLEKAEEFASTIKAVIKYKTSREFVRKHDYVIDGFIECFEGIWKITEEKVA